MSSLARRIAEGTFIISSSNIALAFLGLFTSIILIRTLGRLEFGLLTLALSAYAIASIFLDMGISSVLIADIAAELGKGRIDRAKALLWRYGEVEAIMGLVLASLVFLSSGYFEARYNPTVGRLVQISAFLLVFTAAKNFYTVVFNSHTKFNYFSFMQLTEGLFRLIFVVVLVSVLAKGVEGAMLSYLFASSATVLFSFPLFFRSSTQIRGVERISESLFINTIRGHGKYAMAMNPLQTFNTNIPPWIIEYFLGVDAVGVFSVAWKMMSFFLNLLLPLEQVLMPIVSEISAKGKEKLVFLFHKTIKYSLIFSIIGFIVAELFAPPAINLLFEYKYQESISIFRILAFAMITAAINIPLRPLFFSYRAQKYLLVTYLLNFVLILALGSSFTYLFGVVGMAFAIVFGWGIMISTRYYYLKSLFELSLDIGSLRKFDEFDEKILDRIRSTLRLCGHGKQ